MSFLGSAELIEFLHTFKDSRTEGIMEEFLRIVLRGNVNERTNI